MSKELIRCSAVVTDSKYRLPSECEGTPYIATAKIFGPVPPSEHNIANDILMLEGSEAIPPGTRFTITIEVEDAKE